MEGKPNGKSCPRCGGIMYLSESSELIIGELYSRVTYACIYCGLKVEIHVVMPPWEQRFTPLSQAS